MSIRELSFYISPIVVLAFFISALAEYCPPNYPMFSQSSFIQSAQKSLSLTCYVKSFSPEPPELQTNTSSSMSYSTSTASIATTSTTTTLPSPSPSEEAS